MSGIERYLSELRRELRLRWVPSARFLEETRGHLADAVEAGRTSGLSQQDAEEAAVARYGDARTVAAKFAAGKHRILHWVLLGSAIALGLAIAWMDSRPHWDDDGITAGCLFLSAGILGLIGPRRPWLWALGIGLWVPLYLFIEKPTVGSAFGGCVILAIPMVGAFAGMALRRAIRAASSRQPAG